MLNPRRVRQASHGILMFSSAESPTAASSKLSPHVHRRGPTYPTRLRAATG